MILKDAFLKKYNISKDDFSKSKVDWNEVKEIYIHYQGIKNQFEPTAKDIVERLIQLRCVHSVKYRIKDSEHLIEKIIRKKIASNKKIFSLNNYTEKITDIIGIRALHLFKDDWLNIHDFIINTWDLKEKPIAYIREGDTKSYISNFKDKGCNIKKHEHGYRSVHYLIATNPTKKSFITEIQVRTIFEEGWSEIDHVIRYPYDMKNPLLAQYLNIFNRFAGGADEMGTYIKFLQLELNLKEKKNIEDEKHIKQLQKIINKLKIDKATKTELNSSLRNLQVSTGITINPFQNTLSGIIDKSGRYIMTQKCANCGKDFINNGLSLTSRCENCRQNYSIYQ